MEENVFQDEKDGGWYFWFDGVKYGPYSTEQDALAALEELLSIPSFDIKFSSFTLEKNEKRGDYQVSLNDGTHVGSITEILEVGQLLSMAIYYYLLFNKYMALADDDYYEKVRLYMLLKCLWPSLIIFKCNQELLPPVEPPVEPLVDNKPFTP